MSRTLGTMEGESGRTRIKQLFVAERGEVPEDIWDTTIDANPESLPVPEARARSQAIDVRSRACPHAPVIGRDNWGCRD
jgi:hypothetical protein